MSSVRTLTTDQWAGELGVGFKDWEETKEPERWSAY